MLQDLRNKANTALGYIFDENALTPHSSDYASHLTFFTEVVTCLEAQSARARQLVEERGRGLLHRFLLPLPLMSTTMASPLTALRRWSCIAVPFLAATN